MIDKIALIYVRDKKILSSRSKGKDTYYIPGGKREGDETDNETLVREIKEELNVDIDVDSIEYYGTYEAQAHGHKEGIIVRMTCYFADFKGQPVASSEIEELIWLDSGDMGRISPVDKLIFADLKNQGMIR